VRDYPAVQFYDYSKVYNRLDKGDMPQNYHITLSYSGASKRYSDAVVAAADRHNINLAVVFRDKTNIPTEYLGRSVVSGDKDDLRFLDPRGVIVALYAKGSAKYDKSGFVVD